MKSLDQKTTLPAFFRLFIIAMAMVGVTALTGCGGGGGGGGAPAAPATYSIGGSVSGLINTGLVLQNNSADDLSVNTDGSFSFTTQLTTDTNYAVTILTQPVDHTCSLTSGSGKVASSNITSITVTCTADNQDAQGLYISNGDGTGTFNGISETLTDVKGMIYGDLPNQKFIFFDIGTNVLYDGVITAITLKDFTGTAVVYHDGLVVDNAVTVTGTVTSRSTISMALAANGKFAGGTIEGLFIKPASIYDTAATNARSIGSSALDWKSTSPGSVKMVDSNTYTTNFSVFSNDTYDFITDSTGTGLVVRCDHAGTLISGSTKNIYVMSNEVVTVPVGPCALTTTPNYSGMASIVADDGAGKGTEMWYATTNGTNSIFMILTR